MIIVERHADLEALLAILAAEGTPRHRSTVLKHCQPIGYLCGEPLYDVEACVQVLAAVPTRRAHRRPTRAKRARRGELHSIGI